MTTVAERALIVNADDFGQAPSVNRGIARSHEHGIVTSASLMVRWPAAAEAAEYAAASPSLGVGLHVDLGEWEHRGDGWHARYQVVDRDDEPAVAAELERQLAQFERLIGRPPTHLDSHQHVHREGRALRRLLTDTGARLGIPVRGCSACAARSPSITYSGAFYGQSATGHPVPEAITVDALVALITDLPSGITELGCHPGEPDPGLDTTYRHERAVELEVLCDQRVIAAVAAAGVRLYSFADILTT